MIFSRKSFLGKEFYMGVYLRGKVYWMCFNIKGRQYQESTGVTDKSKAKEFLNKRKKSKPLVLILT